MTSILTSRILACPALWNCCVLFHVFTSLPLLTGLSLTKPQRQTDRRYLIRVNAIIIYVAGNWFHPEHAGRCLSKCCLSTVCWPAG